MSGGREAVGFQRFVVGRNSLEFTPRESNACGKWAFHTMKHGNKTVRVGPARHGRGVFAAGYFETEQLIGQVRGTVIDDPDYASDYCMDLGESLTLEPRAPFRFLNHACEPNSALVVFDVEDEDGEPCTPELWVEALRPIQPGEELTIDYGWTAENAIRCDCGSPRCRGWIAAAEKEGGVTPDDLDLVPVATGPEELSPALTGFALPEVALSTSEAALPTAFASDAKPPPASEGPRSRSAPVSVNRA